MLHTRNRCLEPVSLDKRSHLPEPLARTATLVLRQAGGCFKRLRRRIRLAMLKVNSTASAARRGLRSGRSSIKASCLPRVDLQKLLFKGSPCLMRRHQGAFQVCEEEAPHVSKSLAAPSQDLVP